jgi:hypothetical protein
LRISPGFGDGAISKGVANGARLSSSGDDLRADSTGRRRSDVTILSERPSAGDTIIEKLERNALVAFAVVLMTGDDVGSKEDAAAAKLRARQNVLLELGNFIGKVGRKRVCALYGRIDLVRGTAARIHLRFAVGARSRARSSFSLFSIACSSKLAGCSYEHSRPAIRPRRPCGLQNAKKGGVCRA